MKLVKRQKIVIAFVVVALLLGSILAVTYGNLSPRQSIATFSQLPQLQVFSPQENGTYETVNVPLNITANNATAKITYSLDGAENATLNENVTATPSLTKGIHDLAVYALDNEGKVGDCKNVTFNVDIPYPPTLKLNQQELQSTINYFKSQGLTIQVYDADDFPPPSGTSVRLSIWFPTSVVHLGSKEELATFATQHGVSELIEFISNYDLTTKSFSTDPTYVSFNAPVYNNSWLPVMYSFSATLS